MSGGYISPTSRIRIAADIYRHSTSDDDSGCVLEEYAWVPSGIKPDMVHMYFACLPEDKIPYVNSVGEEWRLCQLQYQLPPHDSDARYCGKLTVEEERELVQFELNRKRECLGRGTIEQLPYDNKRRHCHQCKRSLGEGNMVISAERFGNDVYWHPQCFVCTDCLNLLVDLIYFKYGADVFCGRHHAERIKPRCARCDELIFSEECTEAEGKAWHMVHFSCSECGVQLGGQRYITKNGRIMCTSCNYRNFTIICNTCEREIITGVPHIIQSDTRWHANERCFCCSKCGKNLLGKRYAFKDEKLLCGTCNNCLKRYPKVTFDTKLLSVSNKRRGSVPEPQSRNSPSPPVENIYETVLPCSSKNFSETERTRRCSRRSQSADVRRSWDDDYCYRGHCEKICDCKGCKRNYPEMAVLSTLQRKKYQRCSSCSSSDSDSDDVYLTNYLAVSLSRSNRTSNPIQRNGSMKPVINKIQMAKHNKSMNNCIMS